jgi:hypothetical protein
VFESASAFFGRSDPEPGLPRDVNPKVQCAFDTLVLRISAVRTSYRIWLRSSSTYEPSGPDFQPCPPPACTALNIAGRNTVRFAPWLPECRFLRLSDQCLKARRSVSCPGPATRNSLSLAYDDSCFRRLHPRVNVPGLLLHRQACRFPDPFGISALPPDPVSPGIGQDQCFMPVASSSTSPVRRRLRIHSPLGLLNPSGSKRSATAAANWPAFRTRPISLRSPMLFYF